MGADDVAILRAGDRADDRAAFARARRTPLDREVELAARRRMRGEPDMVNPIGTSHRGLSFSWALMPGLLALERWPQMATARLNRRASSPTTKFTVRS